MNSELQKALTQIENMIAIQKGFAADTDKAGHPSADYHQGLLNGLIMANSILDNNAPEFYTRSNRRKTHKRIRHKGHK